MRFLLCFSLCSLLFFSTNVFSQSEALKEYTGVILNEKGEPVIGATIKVNDKRPKTFAVMSQANGSFSFSSASPKFTITVSYIGYKEKLVSVNGATIKVTLELQESKLDEAVVIGYQSVKRRNVTSAIATLQGKDIQNIPQASFDQMLQGRLPGVVVLSSTGELGAKPTITIRGSTNVDYANANGGNSGPLYVIDGVIFDVNTMSTSYGNNNPLSFINPNDIESIDVLKDASAAAIYGSRGGNGVIIVKTKKSRSNIKTTLTGSAYVGMVTAPNFRTMVTGSAERRLKMDLLYKGLSSADIAAGRIPIQLTDSLNPAFNNNVDWQGLMVRDNAIVSSQDLALSGSIGNNSYRLSFNHYSEQGLLKGYSLEKFTPRLSVSLQPMRGMALNVEVLASSEIRKHGVGGSNGTLFNSWSFPTSLVKLSTVQEEVYGGKRSYYDDNKLFTILGSANLMDTLAKGLVFNSLFSATNYTDKYAYFTPKEVNGVQNSAYDINSSSPGWTWDNYLSYMKEINNHRFNVTAGTSAYSNKRYNSYAYANGVNVSGINTIQTVPSGPNLYVNSSYERKTMASYYGRLTYDYDGKYLLMASLRRDASSIYSSNNRWATFPAVSAGWILSDERFSDKLLPKFINFFKVRASWGITGFDPGSWYAKYQGLNSDASFINGTTGTLVANGNTTAVGGVPSTYNGTTVVSPFPYYNGAYNYGVQSSNDVRWEKSAQTDVGVDIELFKSRVSITADWYDKKTQDKYFYSIPAQNNSGFQYYAGNYVNVDNSGVELAINAHIMNPKSAFQWTANFNIAFNKNMITQLPNGNRDFIFGEPWFQKTLTVGEPLFNYRVWQANGAFPTDADVPVDPITGKKLSFYGSPLTAGDAAYVDMNGDYVINLDDKVNNGNPNPKFTGGFLNTFSYKGFSLSVFCSFLSGRNVFNGSLSDYLNGSRDYNSWGSVAGPAALSDILDQFWQQPGDVTKYPRLVYPNGSAQDPWNIATSYFVENGSYIKVRNATLGYNIPQKITNRMKMSFLNFFVMGDNIYTFKKSDTLADPELADPTTGSVNVVYPSSLKLTIGVNFGF